MAMKLNPSVWSKGAVKSKTAPKVGHRAESGFTLVELMIVVVIIGVIAAVAIPAYKGSVMKSNRAMAKAALLDLAGRQEKYYSLYNNYAFDSSNTTLTTLGQQLYGAGSTATFPINVPGTGPTLYTIAAPTVTTANAAGTIPATFIFYAVPAGSQVGDQCGTFSINSAGQQSASGTGSCW